ncbi:MAG: hypothetical protein JNN07_14500 [Verrucomicrobiales bacterium]|nr:hypothetical protein [Verrucomicrobiales bacterium]
MSRLWNVSEPEDKETALPIQRKFGSKNQNRARNCHAQGNRGSDDPGSAAHRHQPAGDNGCGEDGNARYSQEVHWKAPERIAMLWRGLHTQRPIVTDRRRKRAHGGLADGVTVIMSEIPLQVAVRSTIWFGTPVRSEE